MTPAGTLLAQMRALPLASATQIVGRSAPVILAPHPDDEAIGCGGLISALTRAGVQPRLIFVTDGAGSHPNSRRFPPAALRALRATEAREAARLLGLHQDRIVFMGLADTAAPKDGPALAEAVETIVAIVGADRPAAVLAPWRHDPHGDHLAVHRMAVAVARRIGARHLSYPVWGWTLACDVPLEDDAVAGWRLDIAADLELKTQALEAHCSQVTGLIDDDPTGFRLDAATQAKMLSDYETFLSNP